jgi:hypothetical protein
MPQFSSNDGLSIKQYPESSWKGAVKAGRWVSIAAAILGGGKVIIDTAQGVDLYTQRYSIVREVNGVTSSSTSFSITDLIPDATNIVEEMGIMDVDPRTGVSNTVNYLLSKLNSPEFENNSQLDLIKQELGVFKDRLEVTSDEDLPLLLSEFKDFVQRSMKTLTRDEAYMPQFLIAAFFLIGGLLSNLKLMEVIDGYETTERHNKSSRILSHTLNTMIDLFDPNSTAPEAPISIKNRQNALKFLIARDLTTIFKDFNPSIVGLEVSEDIYARVTKLLKEVTYAKDKKFFLLVMCLKEDLAQIAFMLSRINRSADGDYNKLVQINEFRIQILSASKNMSLLVKRLLKQEPLEL